MTSPDGGVHYGMSKYKIVEETDKFVTYEDERGNRHWLSKQAVVGLIVDDEVIEKKADKYLGAKDWAEQCEKHGNIIINTKAVAKIDFV